jgi:hypothetical protein
MADETKFTLKISIVASFISAIVVFILTVLWVHNTDISKLQTNQMVVMKNVEKMDLAIDKIPERLASIDIQLLYISQAQNIHSKVSTDNNKMLKKNGK